MKHLTLPHEQAVVLQHINESGEEDFTGLAAALRFGRGQLANVLQALHRKHLIVVRKSAYAEAWVRLSAEGKRFIANIWPDTGMMGMSAA